MAEPDGVPQLVRQSALANGATGRAWLDGLSETIHDLEREWDITIGAPYTGGTASYVAPTTMPDGTKAVIKIAMPAFEGQGDLPDEIETLQLAGGHGCVRLLRYDVDRRVLLLEHLGRHLHDLGLPVRTQLEIICATLPRMWAVDVSDTSLPSLADKGVWLADFIARLWDELDHPCSAAVVDRTLSFVEQRLARFDPERGVLLHGDAHSWNTLESVAGSGQFKFVDPDAVIGEREYDLAIPIRELNDELLAGDPLQLGLQRCHLLADLTGTDADAIWQWGMVERVSSGLLLTKEGHEHLASDFLQVAETWANHSSAS